ncbi:hypothetical protein G6F70_001618 [Rhizopus microsporus]|uniref:Uncharacterized protein n=2 Tax=Rhizopus TaxID=4842 RepID=A0A0A1N163_RHIZD|nr:hypothetical protein G6F71_001604 [Rhizopus microsporus]KAG1203196.1 hypothetical protein G6F70_001618 [Rhizopus microsporus]KAG1214414.1 hypothetical protein G6F69_001966 [Rhizopus microsporus]KAG1237914.1 hypothetical protein G6F67_000844 [Rhizopus microsporus]KAG1268662.1 hypothetical protein G6F68_000910 [Rhizopus microsporus]
MHELAKKENTARTDLDEEQQKRIAARAANAMAQVLQRRNRSLMMWGKKAVVKRYPDGRQEIIVPQTLTPEQQHYEFPPRSKLLKKLAVSERLQPNQERKQTLPDQDALQEWFAKKEPTDKDRAVMDWMSDVERHSRQLQKVAKVQQVRPSPTPSIGSNKIQFKSDAGKRWASSIQNTSLQPPDDTCKKHYVPRRLLQKKKHVPQERAVTETASRIQSMWKEYQNKHPQHYIESKIGMTAMASTGERTPMAGMVQLVHMLHESLKIQQQRSADRLEKLESLLKEEKKKRELAEASVKRLEKRSTRLLRK